MTWEAARPLLVDATDRLVESVCAMETPHDTPTALPGWSQAHVLTHVARNADAMRNLFLAARAKKFVAMYASPELREADIMTGATRSTDLIALDVAVSAERLLVELDAMTAEAWTARVPMSADPNAMRIPASMLVQMRLAEVEFHHLDLHVGHSLTRASPAALEQLLDVCHLRMRERTPPFTLAVEGPGITRTFGDGDGPAVAGPVADAVEWLSGRGSGRRLAVSDDTSLPELPSY